MKLSQVLDVLVTNDKYVTVAFSGKEVTKQIYQIKWHHKDLLDKEVEKIIAEEDTAFIRLMD